MPRSPPEMRTVRPFAAGRRAAAVPQAPVLVPAQRWPEFPSFPAPAVRPRPLPPARAESACAVPSSARRLPSRMSAQIRRCTRVKPSCPLFSAAAPLRVKASAAGKETASPTPPELRSAHFFRSRPALRRARRHLCGFDKFPLNNIAQSGEKIKWSPVIFSRSSHFFHRFRGSRAASSGALRPA